MVNGIKLYCDEVKPHMAHNPHHVFESHSERASASCSEGQTPWLLHTEVVGG
jgi:hypothetical protein